MGLVATNSISGGASRKVLSNLFEKTYPMSVWRDEEWTVDGAAVRVALVSVSNDEPLANEVRLDNQIVETINSDLQSAASASGADLSKAKFLPENKSVSFQGVVPRAALNKKDASRLGLTNADFAMTGDLGRLMLAEPNVIVPYLIARDITRRSSDRFIVDFNLKIEDEAALFERPYEYIKPIKVHRSHMAQESALGTWLGKGNDPRYTPTTTFETYPFPDGMRPRDNSKSFSHMPKALAIAEAAAQLNQLHENWLNPPELVKRESDIVPNYPEKIIPINDEAERILKGRTLTNLYNERPSWLNNAHIKLDNVVADVYGFSSDISDEDVLAFLFELNQIRAANSVDS